MPLIEWNETLSVGVADIDEEHRELFRTINELFAAMRSRRGRNQITLTLRNLAAYARNHFATEEGYMDRFGYPETAAHKLEHKAFTLKIAELTEDLDAGRVLVTARTMDFLRDWMLTHIHGTDRKYIPFFKENGLS